MKRLNNITSKPWGGFYDLAESKGKWHLKILFVKKGEQLSLQRHVERSEFWIVAEGTVQVQKGGKICELVPQESIMIRKKEVHRVKGLTNATIIELSFGSHKERDIFRLEDDYGRVGKTTKKISRNI